MTPGPEAREVQDDEMQGHDDENESVHIRAAWHARGRSAFKPHTCATAGIDGWALGRNVGSLRRRTFLARFMPPIGGQAPRFVHREYRGYEQHQQATGGVDHE